MTLAALRRVPPTIHPTALVSPRAILGSDVHIGPFAIVEDGVAIGDGTRVLAAAYLMAGTEIGRNCEIHMGAVVGHAAQIRDRQGHDGSVRIGDGTVLREYVTVHRASRSGQWTVVGDRCLLLAGCHVAHDCRLGNEVTLANGVLLAGHVTIGDRAFLSAKVCVHQFVRIGRIAMVGGLARISKDVPPWLLAVRDGEVRGVNVVGLRRAGLTSDERAEVKRIYRVLCREGLNTTQALARLRIGPASPWVDEMVSFVEQSERGVCAGGPRGQRACRREYADGDTGWPRRV